MKTNINVRLVAIAFVALFMTAFISPASANDEKNVIPVELKFIGTAKNNQPVFHLVFNSAEEREFIVTIRDEYGNILYKDKVKGSSFTKKFVINREELGDSDLKFEITGKDYDKPVVFEINNHTRTVEDVVINKIK
ncbi:MAG: hypothetical protein E6H09_22085 [Bacteroidetes bacterium]|jgi:hypothetical protein|nr:MAG: hypothetical protein E6H09_22085 [Bacteroidota bacterium]